MVLKAVAGKLPLSAKILVFRQGAKIALKKFGVPNWPNALRAYGLIVSLILLADAALCFLPSVCKWWWLSFIYCAVALIDYTIELPLVFLYRIPGYLKLYKNHAVRAIAYAVGTALLAVGMLGKPVGEISKGFKLLSLLMPISAIVLQGILAAWYVVSYLRINKGSNKDSPGDLRFDVFPGILPASVFNAVTGSSLGEQSSGDKALLAK